MTNRCEKHQEDYTTSCTSCQRESVDVLYMTHNTREQIDRFTRQAFLFKVGEGEIERASRLVDCVTELLSEKDHQLQKARHDWLREEIVTLKAVQRDFIARWEHPDSGLPLEDETKSETLYHLQTIIDRYHSELDQDKK